MLTLLATLNALYPLLEMLKHSLLLIHAILHTLKSLLHILKLRGEASLILIHVILHRVESSITNYYKLLHASAERANLNKQIHPRCMIRSMRCLMR